VDIALEAWAIFVVTAVAGSFASLAFRVFVGWQWFPGMALLSPQHVRWA
jgi:hypothetical protein